VRAGSRHMIRLSVDGDRSGATRFTGEVRARCIERAVASRAVARSGCSYLSGDARDGPVPRLRAAGRVG